MKKTLYSQFELLALAYRKWRRPDREVIVGEAGRDSKPGERADHEPALPNGYVHIRSAIQALMAAADDLEASAGETGRDVSVLWRTSMRRLPGYIKTYHPLSERYKQLLDI